MTGIGYQQDVGNVPMEDGNDGGELGNKEKEEEKGMDGMVVVIKKWGHKFKH